MMDIVAAMRAVVAPLDRRIRSLAAACTITAVDDTTDLQTVQITLLSGERLSTAVRRQPFGLSANPPPGAVGLAISIGGSRTHTLVLGGDDTSRPKGLPVGAAELYDAGGNYVLLNNDGTVLVKAAKKITLDAPQGEATGDWTFGGTVLVKETLTVDGDSTLTGDVTAAANVSAGGNISAAGTIDADGAITSQTAVGDSVGTLEDARTTYNGHYHNTPSSGPTEGPTPVMPT